MNPILLDTHAAVWAAEGRLEGTVVDAIDRAAERGELLLAPISAWEIGMLVKKGRLTIASPIHNYISALFGRPGVVTAVMTPTIAAAATTLPGETCNDPVDCILIATAATYGAQLVTRDKAIHDYAKRTRYLRCIAC